jgi:hypothetical protein
MRRVIRLMDISPFMLRSTLDIAAVSLSKSGLGWNAKLAVI